MVDGEATKGAAMAAVESVFAADSAGGPGLVWYEPVATYSGPMSFQVGRCRLTGSKSVLKAPMVSALESTI